MVTPVQSRGSGQEAGSAVLSTSDGRREASKAYSGYGVASLRLMGPAYVANRSQTFCLW